MIYFIPAFILLLDITLLIIFIRESRGFRMKVKRLEGNKVIRVEEYFKPL